MEMVNETVYFHPIYFNKENKVITIKTIIALTLILNYTLNYSHFI